MRTADELAKAERESIATLAAMQPKPRDVHDVIAKAYWTGQLNALQWAQEAAES